MIVKGDQVPLSITIKNEGVVVKPQSIKGVKIKINDKTYSYPDSISYNSGNQKWELPLTQADIYSIGDILEISVQVNFGGNPNLIKTSPTQRIQVGSSLFNQLWG